MSDVATSSEPVKPAPLKILIVDVDVRATLVHDHFMKSLGIDVKVLVEMQPVKVINRYFFGSAEDFDFDIIFVERDMAGLDGKGLAKELRSIGMTTFMVGLISCRDEEEIRSFKAAGLDECLVKPLKVEEVLPLLERARSNRKPT